MTGLVQAVPSWLAGVRAGQFVYHEVIDKAVTIEGAGIVPVCAAAS
ncbi:MAG: hypothetical protein WAS07_04850 [Micropruina sp.]